MYNGGKILTGLVIFLVLMAFPIWYNMATGQASYVPELEKAAQGEECVRDIEYMKSNHMDLLNEWRDRVVRDGERFELAGDGTSRELSLSNTCLSCHVNKDKFCERCHDYMGVQPYCWDCHIVPKELQQ